MGQPYCNILPYAFGHIVSPLEPNVSSKMTYIPHFCIVNYGCYNMVFAITSHLKNVFTVENSKSMSFGEAQQLQ